MPNIEKRPLPPPNSTATTITEADKAEIIARANDVIDYYLNGPGSYWKAGPRKSLQETVGDLRKFKDNVTASKQFADDPNSIMDSIIDLIGKTTEQVEQAARDDEGRDKISRFPPHTEDPIDDPRVTSPRAVSGAAVPISFPGDSQQAATPPQAGALGISSSKPVRILGRRVVEQPPSSAVDISGPAGPDRPDSSSGLLGGWTSVPGGVVRREPGLPVSSTLRARPLGIFSGKPMSDYMVPPSIWGLPDTSAAHGDDTGNWFSSLAGVSGNRISSPTPLLQKSHASVASVLPGYIQYLHGPHDQEPQGSIFGPGQPATSFVRSGNPNAFGAFTGHAAAADVNSQNSDQHALQPGGLLGLMLEHLRNNPDR